MANKTVAKATITGTHQEGSYVLVKNNTIKFLMIPDLDKTHREDISLRANEQKVLEPKWGEPNQRHLMSLIQSGAISAEWVDADFQAPRYAVPEEAPENIRLDNAMAANHAVQIQMQDEVESLRLINMEVTAEDGAGLDIRVMKDPKNGVRGILRLAQWLEENTKKRPAVLKAIKSRLVDIDAM